MVRCESDESTASDSCKNRQQNKNPDLFQNRSLEAFPIVTHYQDPPILNSSCSLRIQATNHLSFYGGAKGCTETISGGVSPLDVVEIMRCELGRSNLCV